jgi:hypothetical protein
VIPTFMGRLQTRFFLVLFVAFPWTLIVTPFLPGHRGNAEGSVAADLYPVTISVLTIVLVLGLVLWEPIYYLLQLMRWEKDWPAMFFMLELIPEAILAWYAFKWIGPASDVATLSTYLWHIIPTWIIMWLFVLGPIKALFIRWRFNGGRIFF